jgi:hypothetical protein
MRVVVAVSFVDDLDGKTAADERLHSLSTEWPDRGAEHALDAISWLSAAV